LPRAVSGSGARYADGRNEIWEAKGEMRVTLADGTKLEGCPRQGG
jgi:membrane-bound inhibitor of C-type lysozyme